MPLEVLEVLEEKKVLWGLEPLGWDEAAVFAAVAFVGPLRFVWGLHLCADYDQSDPEILRDGH